MNISKRTLKRMKNLEGICDFDIKTGIATLHAHIESAEEVINKTLGSPENPVLKQEAIEELEYCLDVVPEEFCVKVDLTVDDYGEYEPQAILKAYDQAFDFRDYSEKSYNKKKKAVMSVFIFVGILFLILTIVAQKNNWFSGGGKALSMIIVILVELLFEVYFEESFVFFTVSRGYKNVTKREEERFLGIIINGHKTV